MVEPIMNTASQFFIAQEDGAVPRWPMPGRKGRVVPHHRFAKQGLSDRSAEQIRDLGHLVARVQSALSNQDRDLPPAVQDIGGGASWSLERSAFGFTRILRFSHRRRILRAGIERGWLRLRRRQRRMFGLRPFAAKS